MSLGHPSPPFTDADLNGLVDGQLDSGRQAEILQRLKTYPAEAAKVEAWREQNDLIRATFSEVASEPVPVSLLLTPPPRLRCVATNGQTTSPMPEAAEGAPLVTDMRRARRARAGLGILAGCFVGAGVWLVLDRSHDARVAPETAFTGPDGSLIAPIVDVLPYDPKQDRGASGAAAAVEHDDLPTRTIPDLGQTGLRFVGATIQSKGALILAYEDGATGRVIVTVSRSDKAEPSIVSAKHAEPEALSWQRHGATYTVSGTLPDHRLRLVAATLRAQQRQEGAAAERVP